MFESKNPEWRIEQAKQKTKRLVDHAVDILWIAENNAVTLYSDVLAKQIRVPMRPMPSMSYARPCSR